MIWIVSEITAILVECFMISRLLINYFGFRSEDKMVLKWAAFFLSLSAIDCLGSFFIPSEMFCITGILLVNLVFSLLFLKRSFFEKITMSIVSYILLYFVNLPVLAFSSMITHLSAAAISDFSAQNIARIPGLFITKLLYFIMTQLILIFRKKERYHFKRNEWVVVISAFSITLVIGFFIYTTFVVELYRVYTYVIIAILLSILDVIIFVFTRKMNIANQKESEKLLLQFQLTQQQNEILQLDHQYHELSILRHDHKSKLNCLYTLMQQKNYDEALIYLDKMIDEQNGDVDSYVNSSSRVINAVINEKFSRAHQENIETSCRILVPIPKYLEYDLSILLANLLDNAIEACKKNEIPSQIILSISDIAGYYRITIKNTIQESVLEENSDLKTRKVDKEQHGWGLKSVQEIVEAHAGTVDFYEKNGMFVADTLLTKNEIRNMGAEKVTLGA